MFVVFVFGSVRYICIYYPDYLASSSTLSKVGEGIDILHKIEYLGRVRWYSLFKANSLYPNDYQMEIKFKYTIYDVDLTINFANYLHVIFCCEQEETKPHHLYNIFG